MKFEGIDPTLAGWASENGLNVATLHRDEEVRSFSIMGPSGRAQIWIEVEEETVVHVWDFGERRKSYPPTRGSLTDRLDEALRTARAWCAGADG